MFNTGGIFEQHIEGYQLRDGQIQMAHAVKDALAKHHHAIIEAECGVGKTLAYLVPLAQRHKIRAIVSTGTRALQEQLYHKDVPLIQRLIRENLRVVYIKGRSNYLCLHRLSQHTEFQQQSLFNQEEDRQRIEDFDNIFKWAIQTTTGDICEIHISEYSEVWNQVCCTVDTCLSYKCNFYHQCFLMKLKHHAKNAHICIVNHHLFFADLMIRNDGGKAVLPDYDIVVFDEAHMIEDIATSYLSKSVGIRLLNMLSKRSKILSTEHLSKVPYMKDKFLESLEQFDLQIVILFNILNKVKHGSYTLSRLSEFSIFKENLVHYNLCVSNLLDNITRSQQYSDDFVSLHQDYVLMNEDLQFICRGEFKEYVYWMDYQGYNLSLNATPVDVAPLFKEKLFTKCSRVILTSATLTSNNSFQYIRERIGLEKADELIVDSPFNFKEQACLYIPTFLPSPKQKSFLGEGTKEIEKIVRYMQGRTLILFTSKSHMNYVYKQFEQSQLPFTILKQGQMGRNELLDIFRHDTHSVLLATNTFWQGIDIQGESLSCVIIDKLPFLVPTHPVIQEKMKLMDEKGKDKFKDYQVPEAIIMLKQGVGRLIRSITDRGLIAILDNRLVTKFYGKIFLDSLPQYKRITQLEEYIL